MGSEVPGEVMLPASPKNQYHTNYRDTSFHSDRKDKKDVKKPRQASKTKALHKRDICPFSFIVLLDYYGFFIKHTVNPMNHCGQICLMPKQIQ